MLYLAKFQPCPSGQNNKLSNATFTKKRRQGVFYKTIHLPYLPKCKTTPFTVFTFQGNACIAEFV